MNNETIAPFPSHSLPDYTEIILIRFINLVFAITITLLLYPFQNEPSANENADEHFRGRG